MQSTSFSSVVNDIPEALSIYINQLVYDQKRRGHDIITLSLGEAFFDIPVFDFKKIDFVKGYHYSDSLGLPELRHAIANFYQSQYGSFVDYKNEILVTAGSKIAIFMAIIATTGPNTEVLIHEPAWLSYQEHIKLAQSQPRFIPYYVEPQNFPDYFTDSTKLIILNNPNNPAGRVYTPEELRSLISVCHDNDIRLLIDEAYSDFLPNGTFQTSIDFDPYRSTVIVANSLSKNMGMSGWRIGYLIAHPDLIQQVLKLNQHLITCAPTILQAYLAHYFDEIIKVTLPQARAIAQKRPILEKVFKRLGLQYLPGVATFYFFVSLGNLPFTSLDLSLYLLLYKNISVAPGSAYGDSTENFVRISIGTESDERIEQALITLSSVLNDPPDIPSLVAERLAELQIAPFLS